MSRPRREILSDLLQLFNGRFTASDICEIWPIRRFAPSPQEVAGLLRSCEGVEIVSHNHPKIYRRVQ